jgi:hypothetical protein
MGVGDDRGAGAVTLAAYAMGIIAGAGGAATFERPSERAGAVGLRGPGVTL